MNSSRCGFSESWSSGVYALISTPPNRASEDGRRAQAEYCTDREFLASIDRMTQRAEPKTPAIEGIHGAGVGMILNHVSSNVLSGLIETLAAPPYNGHADLPVLAGQHSQTTHQASGRHKLLSQPLRT